MKKIILFGPPGAGKGTIAAQIKEIIPNIAHISTGDIFRENVKESTKLGKRAKKFMDKGVLIPDEIVIDMVKARLKKEDVLNNGFILDGFPRTLDQAKALEKIAKIDFLLLLEVPSDIIIKRILGRYSCNNCGQIYNKFFLPPRNQGICDKCGAPIKFEQRTDDNEETLRKRLEVYENNAKPIIEFYSNQEKVKQVDYTNQLPIAKLKEILEL
jgi:adenylate kinase